uniref:Uncharacterized protein n=1 Tax=Panagrellus redivivus TaxID=6233 RepID=A0A7E4V0Y7_PANRE
MLITLYIFLFFVTHSHAGLITSSNNTTFASSSANSAQNLLSLNTNAPPSFSHLAVENELAKISTSCFDSRDYEMVAGNFIKHGTVRMFFNNLVSDSTWTIGLAEIRRALNFAPLRPWKRYNSTIPCEGDLASMSNIEAYYDLIEPIPSYLTLDGLYFFEKNIATAIAYLDERLPSFRNIFRRMFEEMHQYDEGLIDRKSIDRMINELSAIHGKMEKAVLEMRNNEHNRCDPVEYFIL